MRPQAASSWPGVSDPHRGSRPTEGGGEDKLKNANSAEERPPDETAHCVKREHRSWWHAFLTVDPGPLPKVMRFPDAGRTRRAVVLPGANKKAGRRRRTKRRHYASRARKQHLLLFPQRSHLRSSSSPAQTATSPSLIASNSSHLAAAMPAYASQRRPLTNAIKWRESP